MADGTFGQWLKKQREDQGLSRPQLARRISEEWSRLTGYEERITVDAIRAWESGKRGRPYENSWVAISRGLGLPADAVEVALRRAHGRGTVPPLPDDNLPLLPTPSVGRDSDADEVQRILSQPAIRLLTLTGPGGVGKTRLAQMVATAAKATFPDGFYYVALDQLDTPNEGSPVRNLIAVAIAAALGAEKVDEEEALIAFLHGRHILLILDNFEHVVEAAPLVANLLGRASGPKILVTSREVLKIRGEREWPVPPLALPDPARLTRETAARLGEYPAVALFVARAQDADPGFQLTADNAATVAEICLRLDGLPLAIELAAPWVRTLSPQSLLAQLTKSLALLIGGSDREKRQRTMRGAIEWSYNLLDDTDKALFRRLGLFRGGFTGKAAEILCAEDSGGGNGRPLLDPDILLGLDSLEGKSLLRGRTGDSGGSRFTMLFILREYAMEQLEASEEVERFRRRHALYYKDLTAGADPWLRQGDGIVWRRGLASLDQEHENLRAAVEWCKTDLTAAREIGLLLVGALTWYVWRRGHFTEGLDWLCWALDIIEQLPSEAGADRRIQELRAKLLFGAGRLNGHQGDYTDGGRRLEESIAICRELGERHGEAIALVPYGVQLSDNGDLAGAAERLARAAELFEEVGDTLGRGHALYDLADVERHQGKLGEAGRLLMESLTLREQADDRHGVACSKGSLGRVYADRDDYAGGRQLICESIAVFREIGDRSFLAWSLYLLADTYFGQGVPSTVALSKAEHALYASLRLYQALKGAWGLVRALEGLVLVAGFGGYAEQAGHLNGLAGQLRAKRGPRTPMDGARYSALLERVYGALDEQGEADWVRARDESWRAAPDRAVHRLLDAREQNYGPVDDEIELCLPDGPLSQEAGEPIPLRMPGDHSALRTQRFTDKLGATYAFEYCALSEGTAHTTTDDRVGAALADISRWATAAFPVYTDEMRDRLIRGKLDQARHLALVRAEADGRVVGFHIYKNVEWNADYAVPVSVVYIDQMGFDPALWDRGLATATQGAIFDLLDANVVCASSGNPRLYGASERLARQRGLALYPHAARSPRPIYDLARRINEALSLTSAVLDEQLVRTYNGPTSRGTGGHPLLDEVLHLGPNQHVFYLLLKAEAANALVPAASQQQAQN